MVISTLSNASRALASRSSKAGSKRFFGSGGPTPKWEGLDKVLRDRFPEDYQVAGVFLSGYGILIGGYLLKSKFTKTPEAAPAPVAVVTEVASGDDILPATDSTNFEAFINNSDKFGKFLESEESVMKWVDGLSKA
mmetsp:Transcript_24126/g.27801  ORF Transcript_24126/g.27801 Transcript_24126/m.27801 type:complete len:136 (+) Transcript_24126:80-487(+)